MWFAVEVQTVAPDRPNVLGSLGEKGGGRCLLLEGHTDVVTEGDPREWTHAPFGADLVDGRIYGRGAADMKGGLGRMEESMAGLASTTHRVEEYLLKKGTI